MSAQKIVLGEEIKPKEEETPKEEVEEDYGTEIYSVRVTASREDQVIDFIAANARKKGYAVYSCFRPHGMRGYIFIEAKSLNEAEVACFNIPYARGVLKKPIPFKEISSMIEPVRTTINIKKNDIAEIISGPFKREKARITRIDKQKGDVVVELLEAAVPIPVTVKIDAVKVIRRKSEDEKDE